MSDSPAMHAAQLSFSLDRRALARSFDRAAAGYDAAAQLQQRVRAELLERLRFFALAPQSILDLGAGTCQGAVALHRRYARARVIALDIAPGMLLASPRPGWPRRRFERVCADAYALPLAAGSTDLVYSSLMLQWCDRPDMVFRELARILKPGGVFVFASFGPDTLHELRLAWQSVDDGVHVSQFPDMPQLGAALMDSGLAEPVMDVERHRLLYPDVHSLMRELQRIGARNAARARSRALTGRARLHRMIAAYETRRTAAGLPATFEVIFGAAFGAATQAGGPENSFSPGEHVVPLAALGRRSR
ncbi:MAG TPA: malonyl-ACP O-methyltransferase BioC [Steroidobacteraceae bacterium]|nr:malonyl-ACP O-methyltransferase BioC [Steroidobacteraceae bacterium]